MLPAATRYPNPCSRMKPLGFTLDQMRDLLDATDRLDSDDPLDAAEREVLLGRVRVYL
jgi:hypothetical protein